MRSKSNLRKGEAGQVLVYVTIIVALAGLIMAPLLRFTYTGHQSAQTREERMLELYAADAGVEDAMYQIKNELAGIGDLEYGGTAYYPGTPDSWNDRSMDVSVEKVWIPEELPGGLAVDAPTVETDYSDSLVMVGLFTIMELAAAEDDYESGGWSGGEGWSGGWAHTGGASIGSGAGAHWGNYYLKLAESNGSAERATDLSGFYEPRLQFYARAGSLEEFDTAQCKVSTDGENWDTLMTWADGNDTDTYDFANIDISSYGNSSEFWVAFEADLLGGTIASDGFEDGWSGGPGWLYDWLHSGDASIISDGRQHSGSYHLRLRRSSGHAMRAVDLSVYEEPRLRFWARARSFESSDRAYCLVSANGVDWTVVKTWSSSQSYTPVDIDLSPYASGSSEFWIAFDAQMNSSYDYFYVDDLEIVDDDHFYVDDLWIGNDVDTYTVEIAYTENIGSVYMDSLSVWLPPGPGYMVVVDAWGIPQAEPDHITSAFAGGTVVQWDFDPRIDLSEPVGGGGAELPIVRSISFKFAGGEEDQGMFAWLTAYTVAVGGIEPSYISWDTGYELYRATSQASHEIWGSNTKVEAYVGQGETKKTAVASYGNYRATGSPLLIDYAGSSWVKEKPIDPLDPDTWVTIGEVLYDGRSTISDLPDDGEVIAAWLYWSAFIKTSDWSAPDEVVSFMYPKAYGPETFEVLNGDEVYTVAAYVSDGEPIVQVPADVLVYLTPTRYYNELLGTAYSDNGNDTFATDYKPVLMSPDPEVFLDGYPLFEGEDYTIEYSIGKVTIIDDALEGNVYIDYSVSGSAELTKGSDYSVDYVQGKVTITNEYLVGNATVSYWAQHWETVEHAAYDRYGTYLEPAQNTISVGSAYACFADVTDLVGGTGNGEFAVRDVDATLGADGPDYGQKCFSGWSLILLYKSAVETAHQFYLYDPIHNADDCPFHSDKYTDIPFTLEDFYPPEGVVEGRLTYFVGEGDDNYEDDYIRFKGASQMVYNPLSDPPTNPVNNVMNEKSTTGEAGIDIDTYDILDDVGSDTEANVQFSTDGDRWYLIYVILSFKTAMVPKEDYAFNVAAVTYTYELGTLQ